MKAWLSDYLSCHISSRSSVHGLEWQPSEIEKHIDTHRLVERDWQELSEATGSSTSFVEVVSNGEALVGIVHASIRTDRYL